MTRGEPSDQSFPKTARLLSSLEFAPVHRSPFFAADAVLVIKAISNNSEETRLGLSVSKKVGNAVVRNRWKRVIRDAFRRQRSSLPAGMDLVVRPKKGAVCDYQMVYRSIGRLTERLEKKIKKSAAKPQS